MTSQLRTRLGRTAGTLMVAALALTACGTTKGTALAPADGLDVQGSATTTTSGLAGGDAYLTADALGARTGGATVQTNDRSTCAPSGTTCLEP